MCLAKDPDQRSCRQNKKAEPGKETKTKNPQYTSNKGISPGMNYQ